MSNELSTENSKLKNMKECLMKGAESMKLVLPATITPEVMTRFAMNAAQNNPTLYLCSIQSVGLSLMNAAALGLEPNGRDGHLVPYNQWNPQTKRKEYVCQFIPDYKGFIKLMYQNRNLKSVSARAVRDKDEFDFELGSNSFIHHKPPLKDDRGELIASWAMFVLKDGSTDFVVLTQNEVLKHKAASPSKGSDKSPWNLWEDSMWAKSAVRVLQKFAPLGPAIESASDYEQRMELETLP